MSEEIVTGLSRFSYLRVISRSSTERYANETVDVRSVGKDLGARYVLEGSLRQAGSQLRVAVQLVDAATGAHLWAETYNRPFDPNQIFELQDDLVPQIVSTVADAHGVLPRTMSEALRGKSPDELSPYEAVLRSFGYGYRVFAEEHAIVQAGLERAVERSPGYADAWGMLSLVYGEDYANGFGTGPDPLGRALMAARRAAEAEPGNALAYNALARAHFFRKEFQAFRAAADRTLELNPLNSPTVAGMGFMIAYAGDWDHGCALVERATRICPRHPGWYWLPLFYNAYRKEDYRGALSIALKVNLPQYFFNHAVLAVACGQLGERDAAAKALKDLLALKPDFAATARAEYGKWFQPELVEHLIDGLRKAGLAVPAHTAAGPDAAASPGPTTGGGAASSLSEQARDSAVAIAVLPFSDMSPGKDQEYLCEGMAEEIMNALVRIDGIRVASRTSAFRARRDGGDLAAIARALSVEPRPRGQRADVGQPASSHRAAHRRRERLPALVGEIRPGGRRRLRRPGRDRRRGRRGGEGPARSGSADHPRPSACPQPRSLSELPDGPASSVRQGGPRRGRSGLRGGRPPRSDSRAFVDRSRGEPRARGAHESRPGTRGLRGRPKGPGDRARSWRESRRTASTARPCGLHRTTMEGHGGRGSSSDRAPTLPRPVPGLVGDVSLPAPEARRSPAVLRAGPGGRSARVLSLHAHGTGAADQREAAGRPPLRRASALLREGGRRRRCLLEPGERRPGAVRGRHRDRGARCRRFAPRGHFLGLLGWALATAGRKDEARTLLEELRARPAAAPTIVSEGWLLGALGEIDAAFEVLARAEDECQLWLYYTGLPAFDPLRADPRFAALVSRLELPSAGASRP